MLDGIRLRNIRSLVDTGWVNFRPITLLVGQNSSGKSTFLRSLPLLRQSIRTRTNSPVLWYGDLVDFGSFSEVISNVADNKAVGFGFKLDYVRADNPYYQTSSRQVPVLRDIHCGIELHEISGSTRLKSLVLRVSDDHIVIQFDQRGSLTSAFVNETDCTRLLTKEKYLFTQNELIPQVFAAGERARGAFGNGIRPLAIADQDIFSFFAERFDRRVSIGTIRALTRRLAYEPGEGFVNRINAISLPLKSWDSVKKQLLSPFAQEELDRLRGLYMMGLLPELLHSISRSVSTSLRDLAYLGPSRATGERYYRHQELAVDQIDPQGQNLAMYLYSLTPQQREAFSEWLERRIGYALQVGRQGGHIQVELRERGSNSFHNLADMGYGFSQILPVMAQIWGREIKITGVLRRSSFMVIEQPELHLHPAYQARIADVLAASVNADSEGKGRSHRFVVETHSESLINRLGELVYTGEIKQDDVAIFLFHRLPSSNRTEITKSTFDSQGTLSDWPLGFFSSKVA